MKTTHRDYTDDEGDRHSYDVITFYNGYTVTANKYNRINNARLLRRTVLNKKIIVELENRRNAELRELFDL